MKHIQLSSRTQLDWSGKFVDESNFDILLNESAEVRKPDGTLLLVLLKNALSKESVGKAWSVLKEMHLISNNRGIATGSEGKQRMRMDGTMSAQRVAEPCESGIIGYFERTVRFPYCRPCAWNQNNPDKWVKLLPMFQEVSKLYEQNANERWTKQKEIVDKTCKDFVIPETVFTTVTVNKNFRTACHLDAGDLPQGISCMSLIRQGKYQGGDIVFPDFRVAAKLDTCDLIIFDPHEFHGNTKIIPMSEDYVRCTLVYYYRELVQQCLTNTEEMNQAKNRKPGDPLFAKLES